MPDVSVTAEQALIQQIQTIVINSRQVSDFY